MTGKRIGEVTSISVGVLGFLLALYVLIDSKTISSVDVEYRVIPRHVHFDGYSYEFTSDLLVSNKGDRDVIITQVGHALGIYTDSHWSGYSTGVAEMARLSGYYGEPVEPGLPLIVTAKSVAVIRSHEFIPHTSIDSLPVYLADSSQRVLYLMFEAVDVESQVASMAGSVAIFPIDSTSSFEFVANVDWLPLEKHPIFVIEPDSGKHTPETW